MYSKSIDRITLNENLSHRCQICLFVISFNPTLSFDGKVERRILPFNSILIVEIVFGEQEHRRIFEAGSRLNEVLKVKELTKRAGSEGFTELSNTKSDNSPKSQGIERPKYWLIQV